VTRIHAKGKGRISRWHEIRFLALVTAGLCVPALGTLLAIFSTAEPDISDLTPISKKIGDDLILNWVDLERRPHALQQGASVFAGARVQALGYMMESDHPIRAGESVQEFVLLPDAGNLLHPAHRFGDQMISIHLAGGDPVSFAPKQLVWVRGVLRARLGDPAGEKPLYALQEAMMMPASKADIAKYFR